MLLKSKSTLSISSGQVDRKVKYPIHSMYRRNSLEKIKTGRKVLSSVVSDDDDEGEESWGSVVIKIITGRD